MVSSRIRWLLLLHSILFSGILSFRRALLGSKNLHCLIPSHIAHPHPTQSVRVLKRAGERENPLRRKGIELCAKKNNKSSASSPKKKGGSSAKQLTQSASKESLPSSASSVSEDSRKQIKDDVKVDFPAVDPLRGPFLDMEPEDADREDSDSRISISQDNDNEREARLQVLRQQAILQDGLAKISFGDKESSDPEALALQQARERAERIRNRVDEQIELLKQLSQIVPETYIQDGKEFLVHPLYKELGIALPSPRGKTAEEFDIVENLRQIQSTFLGLRPSPAINNGSDSNSTDEDDEGEVESEVVNDYDDVFQPNSTAKQFTRFYPYGYYNHIPGITLKSPFDIFGNIYPQPNNYYKLLPTLDAFRLTQEFWRQLFDREEDLTALWYAEDYRKEQELKNAPWWQRALIFGFDNDNGSNQSLEDKITKYCEALLWGALFLLFLNVMIGCGNGLMNYVFRKDWTFFFETDWWALPLKDVIPHLPRFEAVQVTNPFAATPLSTPPQ